MKANIYITTSLLILVSATLACADFATVGAPVGYIRSFANIVNDSENDYSYPPIIDIGPTDNPFNRSLSASAAISLGSANALASQNSGFTLDADSLHISSSGTTGSAITHVPYIDGAGTGAYSSYSLDFIINEDFTYTLSSTSSLSLSGNASVFIHAGIFVRGGGRVLVAPSNGTLTGTLPAGEYVFGAVIDSPANSAFDGSDNASASASYSMTFIATVPEPSSALLIAFGSALCLANRRRRSPSIARIA